MTVPDCYVCGREARFGALPPRERVASDEHWRVAHAFDTALPGWLVLLPRRHVTAVHDLTDAEAAALGPWQVRLSRALRSVTGCAKTYVVQFAEAEGSPTHTSTSCRAWRTCLPSNAEQASSGCSACRNRNG